VNNQPLDEQARQYLWELSKTIEDLKFEVDDMRRTIWALQEALDYSPPENPYDTVPF
jgi:hypothetical protein